MADSGEFQATYYPEEPREASRTRPKSLSPSASPPTPLLLLPLLTSFTPDKLSLFLDSRKSCISQILSNCSSCKTMSFNMINGFWEVLKIIQDTLGQVGELFLLLSDKTLFYKVILGSPSASQLFGSIPDPDEEVKLWKLFRDNLEFKMVTLERDYVAKICSTWLKTCGDEVVNKINGKYLVDSISTGKELASAEKLVRETMDDKQVLAGILDWLKCVIGSEVELPWNRIRELFLAENADLWNEIFEDVFVQRMKTIIDYSYDDLISIYQCQKNIIGIVEGLDERADLGGGVWFFEHNKKGDNDLVSCLTAYFGVEVEGIQDAVDNCCHTILEDLLSFLDSPNASVRLDILVSYLQNKCYQSISSILMELKNELDRMPASWENARYFHPTIVERSLFIGRIMFAFQKHIPIILGSPKQWFTDTKNGVYGNTGSLLRHSSIREGDNSCPQLEKLNNLTRDLSIRDHELWIKWVSSDLAAVLSRDLAQDDGLSTSTPLRGWEDSVVKQENPHKEKSDKEKPDKEKPDEDMPDESEPEMKLSLPSMSSLYITSFLFKACKEIHRVGGHVLD